MTQVAPLLGAAGCRVIVPYLRGFGPTRFLSAATPRSGQQAALGNDLKEFMDALAIKRAALAGYDWGGRAACIVAALWPERARCLVTGNGYNIQDIPNANSPAAPEQELRYWYQYYFHTERGRAGLDAKPPRLDPAAVATVVAELAFRRCAPSSARRRPGIIPISSRLRSSPTAIATATRRAIRRWRRSSGSSRRSRRFRSRPSCCKATPMACAAGTCGRKYRDSFTGRCRRARLSRRRPQCAGGSAGRGRASACST